ncbi:MAG: hypothetical protein LBD55_07205 [Treponema sp.]|jgi:hypothetical protein|nr:hypothetical protein [Treponema sp.]
MKGHTKKLIAPVIIVIGINLYSTGGGIAAAILAVPIIVKITAGILSILSAAYRIIIERIKEVQASTNRISGEGFASARFWDTWRKPQNV